MAAQVWSTVKPIVVGGRWLLEAARSSWSVVVSVVITPLPLLESGRQAAVPGEEERPLKVRRNPHPALTDGLHALLQIIMNQKRTVSCRCICVEGDIIPSPLHMVW
jgi:hypothetical protein